MKRWLKRWMRRRETASQARARLEVDFFEAFIRHGSAGVPDLHTKGGLAVPEELDYKARQDLRESWGEYRDVLASKVIGKEKSA